MTTRKPKPNPDRPVARVQQVVGAIFGSVAADLTWTPQINIYQTPSALQVCVNLAGVPKDQIGVAVQPGRLIINGVRIVPEPEDHQTHCIRVMEIDHGRFERIIPIPDTAQLERVSSQYRDGMLWIELPLDD